MARRYLFSGSGVLRATECPASCVLPQSDDVAGEPAQAGITVHRYIQRAKDVGAEAALAEIAADAPGRAMCAALDIDALPVDLLNAELEIALAYDATENTSRRLVDAAGEPIVNREYERAVPPLSENEVPMTLDAVEWIRDDDGYTTLVVTDWKSGGFHAGYREQVTLGACAAANLPDAPKADAIDGQLVYLRGGIDTHRWQITKSDMVDMNCAVFDAINDAANLRGRTITVDDVTTGEHCDYCRAVERCPKRVEAARELATIEPVAALATFDENIASDEGAALWHERIAMMTPILAEMRERLDARAMARPFALPNGDVVGPVSERGDRYVTNADAMYQRLVDALGVEAADAAMPAVTKRKATVGAIEKALGKPAMKQLEADRLIARGAETVRVGVTKTKKGKAA